MLLYTHHIGFVCEMEQSKLISQTKKEKTEKVYSTFQSIWYYIVVEQYTLQRDTSRQSSPVDSISGSPPPSSLLLRGKKSQMIFPPKIESLDGSGVETIVGEHTRQRLVETMGESGKRLK